MALIPSSQWNSHSLTRSLLQMYLGFRESGPSPSWVNFGERLYEKKKKKTVDPFFRTNSAGYPMLWLFHLDRVDPAE